MKIIFLDTETTGNELGKDRLCQVCYQVGDQIKAEYFKPPVPISVKSMSITHITNKMVADKPAFEGSEMKQELETLLQDHALVAHNAKFDIAMLEAEGLKIPRFICTLKLAHYLDSEGLIPEYNLQYLRYFLDLEIQAEAHDAKGDVLVLSALFARQWRKFKESRNQTDEEIIEEMVKISKTPLLFKKFGFGKHKDKSVAEVAKTDRGYLEWLLRQKQEAEEFDEDWIYTLNHHLGKLF